MSTTANLGLTKPTVGGSDSTWGNTLNSNFDLLVSKCRGVTPARDNTRPSDSQSLWDDMKDEYKKENPDVQLMGDKFIKPSKKKLIIPKYLTDDENVILPLPKPKTNE